MSADAKKNLESAPDKWPASEISCFFTGRADWGLFASVFPCLWGEVAQKLTDEDDRAQALAPVKSNDFLQVVQRFRQIEGTPHLAVAYRLALAEKEKQSKCKLGIVQSKRALVSPSGVSIRVPCIRGGLRGRGQVSGPTG